MNEEHLEFVHKRLRISREIQLISTVIHIGLISLNCWRGYLLPGRIINMIDFYFLVKFKSGTGREHQGRKSDHVFEERFEINFATIEKQ